MAHRIWFGTVWFGSFRTENWYGIKEQGADSAPAAKAPEAATDTAAAAETPAAPAENTALAASGDAETVESLRAERDAWQQKFIDLSACVALQQESMTSRSKHEEAVKSLQRSEAKFEENAKFAIEKFVKDVLPVVDTLELGLGAISHKDRAADPKLPSWRRMLKNPAKPRRCFQQTRRQIHQPDGRGNWRLQARSDFRDAQRRRRAGNGHLWKP